MQTVMFCVPPMTRLCLKHFLVETIYILYMSDSNLYPYPYTERGKIDDFSPFPQIKSPCIGQFWCFKVGAALLQYRSTANYRFRPRTTGNDWNHL